MTVKSDGNLPQSVQDQSVAEPARQRTVHWLVTLMIAVTALLYFLIGFKRVSVLDNPNDQRVFGLIAGSGYVLAVAAMLVIKHYWLYVTGALLQVFILWQYFSLAPERLPHYEVWGLLLRAPQIIILVGLVYLALVRRNQKLAHKERSQRI